jgi:RNA polymerase primary sigma factor
MTRTSAAKDPPPGSLMDIYLSQIDQTPLLRCEEEKQLARLIGEGDSAARERMIRANLRLVVKIARSYLGAGVSLEDLIAEGNLGLIRAVEAFDPSMNTRFSTYASYWIKQSIKRFLVTTRALRLPSYAVQMLREWRRAAAALEEKLRRTPTDQEIGGRLHYTPRQLQIIRKALQVMAPARHTGRTESELPLEDLLAGRADEGPENHVAGQELVDRVMHLLGELGEREELVLRMRFGLGGSDPKTLSDIGKCLGLTRERVRQIEREALGKLNEKLHPAEAE